MIDLCIESLHKQRKANIDDFMNYEIVYHTPEIAG
jgi:hypothetical protein